MFTQHIFPPGTRGLSWTRARLLGAVELFARSRPSSDLTCPPLARPFLIRRGARPPAAPTDRVPWGTLSRPEFWAAKFARNVKRNREVQCALEELGWRIAIVRECRTTNDSAIVDDLLTFLERPARMP